MLSKVFPLLQRFPCDVQRFCQDVIASKSSFFAKVARRVSNFFTINCDRNLALVQLKLSCLSYSGIDQNSEVG